MLVVVAYARHWKNINAYPEHYLLSAFMSKAEFEVKDPKCVCQGLNKVLEMAKFYDEYATDTKSIPHSPENNKKALKVVNSLLEVLKPSDACGDRGGDWIQKARIEAIKCKREGEGCMMALEWVRAAIHDDQCLDAKLTCQKYQQGLGSDFVEAQPWNDIRWSMYCIANFGLNTTKDAIKTLEKSLNKNKCSIEVQK